MTANVTQYIQYHRYLYTCRLEVVVGSKLATRQLQRMQLSSSVSSPLMGGRPDPIERPTVIILIILCCALLETDKCKNVEHEASVRDQML